jgi:hypothetical protein
MFATFEDFLSTRQGDSAEFMGKVRTLVIGVARDYEPARLYVIRIDNWFGPRWMKFAGKFTAGKHFAIGVHKRRSHVPPFVPQRVVVQAVFVGPGYEEMVARPPLHIECPSSKALVRRIEDIDKDAAFIWFGGESEAQGRGAVMVYLPVALERTERRRGLRDCGAFYVGYSLRKTNWAPSMLRGVSLGEVANFQESGRAFAAEPTLPNCH